MKNHFLIVDDNALARKATAWLVEHVTGCVTECCDNAGEALRIFNKAPEKFACVVTDFDMPGMNGLQLGGCLHAAAPDLKLLLVTGSPGALAGVDIREWGFDCMLEKPFDLATMRQALFRVLPSPDNSPVRSPHAFPGNETSFFERPHGILRAAV